MTESWTMPLLATPPARGMASLFTASDDVLRLVNQERKVAGLAALRTNKHLLAAAQGHALDMAVRNYVAHRNPEGQSVGARIAAAGYKDWVYAGENIGAGHATPEQIVAAWWNSPGHRRNLLDGDFAEAGVGYAYQEDDAPGVVLWNGVVSSQPYWHYWCLDMARRKQAAFLPWVLARLRSRLGAA